MRTQDSFHGRKSHCVASFDWMALLYYYFPHYIITPLPSLSSLFLFFFLVSCSHQQRARKTAPCSLWPPISPPFFLHFHHKFHHHSLLHLLLHFQQLHHLLQPLFTKKHQRNPSSPSTSPPSPPPPAPP